MHFTSLLLVLCASSFASALETPDLLPRHAEAVPAFAPPPKPPSAPKPPNPIPRPDPIAPAPMPPAKPTKRPDPPEGPEISQGSQSVGGWSTKEPEGGLTTSSIMGGSGQESSSSISTTTASATSEAPTLQIVSSDMPSRTSSISPSPTSERISTATKTRIDSLITPYCVFACIFYAKWLFWSW